MGLRSNVENVADVKELLVKVPMWNDEPVLFRGMSLAALEELQTVDLESAVEKNNVTEMLRTLQATMADPDTKELAFLGDEGLAILRTKSFESIMFCVNNGSNKVLGIDPENEAGKDSSSTETETLTTDA